MGAGVAGAALVVTVAAAGSLGVFASGLADGSARLVTEESDTKASARTSAETIDLFPVRLPIRAIRVPPGVRLGRGRSEESAWKVKKAPSGSKHSTSPHV